jgi:hypothetical protein
MIMITDRYIYKIYPDIYVNCNWIDTRWQQYSTHLHTKSTQNNTMRQNTQNSTYITIRILKVHAVVHWLRHCATNRKVVGSIPDSVVGIFH